MVITTTPLREQMRRALRIRNVSPRTEYIYIHMVAGFAAHFRRSPDRLGRPHVEEYLLFIRDVKRVSYCWWNQCVCALRFFYRYVLDRPNLVQRIPLGSSRTTSPGRSLGRRACGLSRRHSLPPRPRHSHRPLLRWYSSRRGLPPASGRHRLVPHASAHSPRQGPQGSFRSIVANRPGPASPVVARERSSERTVLPQQERCFAPAQPIHRAAGRQDRRS